MSPEMALLEAMSVLMERGRAFADYGGATGPVCGLGAIAVACKLPADAWRLLDEIPASEWGVEETVMVAAGRRLLAVAVPHVDADDVPLPDLVGLLGDWNDRASDNELFGALTRAGLPTAPTFPYPAENGAAA
jgi:hypothetical protein